MTDGRIIGTEFISLSPAASSAVQTFADGLDPFFGMSRTFPAICEVLKSPTLSTIHLSERFATMPPPPGKEGQGVRIFKSPIAGTDFRRLRLSAHSLGELSPDGPRSTVLIPPSRDFLLASSASPLNWWIWPGLNVSAHHRLSIRRRAGEVLGPVISAFLPDLDLINK